MGRLRFTIIARLFELIFWLLFAAFTLVKWLVIPPVILFDFLILFPLGRFMVRVNKDPAFREVSPDELPDVVWRHLESVRRRFSRQGFTSGKYLYSGTVVPGMDNYTFTMVNHAKGMGAGIIYLRPKQAKDEILDKTACEFSCILNSRYVDMSNTEVVEGFLPMPERDRLMLRDYDDEGLCRVYRKFIEVNNCPLGKEILDGLENNPRIIINKEMKIMFSSYKQRGLIYTSETSEDYRLTWKGAFISCMQTVWPMSTWYGDRLQRDALAYLRDHGVDAEQVAWNNDEYVSEGSLELLEPITTLTQAVEIAQQKAGTRIVNMQPVSLAISIMTEKSPYEWESVDVFYEESEDYPERKSLWRSTVTVNISNFGKEFCLLDDEDYLLGYEEAEECGVRLHQPLPQPLEPVIEVSDAVSKIKSVLNVSDEEDPCMEMIELKMVEGQLSWCAVHYQKDVQIEVVVNARNGMLIAKNEEAYS
jgi:hypothetical protein